MNEKQIRKRLLEMKASLQATVATGDDATATVELDQTRMGRLSRMDAMQAQAMSQEAQRRREVKLKMIDAALGRLDQNRFGDCKDCEEPIAAARIANDPTVVLCIECAGNREN